MNSTQYTALAQSADEFGMVIAAFSLTADTIRKIDAPGVLVGIATLVDPDNTAVQARRYFNIHTIDNHVTWHGV